MAKYLVQFMFSFENKIRCMMIYALWEVFCRGFHRNMFGTEAKFVGLSVPHETFWSSALEGSDRCPQDPDAGEPTGAELRPTGSTCLEGQADEAVKKKSCGGEEIWGTQSLRLDLRMLFEVMGDPKQGGLSKEGLGHVAANKM